MPFSLGLSTTFPNKAAMKKNVPLLLIFSFFNTFLFAQISVTNLLCENKSNPVTVDEQKPRFSWQLVSPERNVMQTAYEIRVATDPGQLTSGRNLVWNTGKVAGGQSVHVPYSGPALASAKYYFWQVRVWDNKTKVSAWSTPASWQMGLKPGDWKASWIRAGFQEDTITRPSPLFRKVFTITKPIKTATAFITSHGMYEAMINNKRVGNLYLTPGWTSYNKRLQYQAYDIKQMLSQGVNAIGVQLGSGWFRGNLAWGNNKNLYGKELALLCELVIEYTDGTTDAVYTNENWKSSTGSIVFSEIYHGEHIDARKDKWQWTAATYNDKDWHGVAKVD